MWSLEIIRYIDNTMSLKRMGLNGNLIDLKVAAWIKTKGGYKKIPLIWEIEDLGISRILESINTQEDIHQA